MPERKKGKTGIRLWTVLFWLAVWQAGSMALGQAILLVSPVAVARRLAELAITAPFWSSIGFSLLRIASGFLIAVVAGVVLAAAGARFRRLRELISPAMLTIKAIPVASFVILVLVWVPSKNLSVVISLLIVLPVVYTNIIDGIDAADPKLLEMTRVFELPALRAVRYIYVSQVLPYFRAACSVGLGLCWKAGVAAEVIGIPKGSIGEKLYESKIFLNTADLFAWTATIVIISYSFEKIFMLLIDKLVGRIERM
ncbi:MAG: ABC transporter permease subunit [Clostridiales Family XIII bacterium]|jgi:NitT/TauT family transport system permease protein|nr:ABC transporter permease subunit [Clostridiales Family XIII bacterium]